MSVDSSVMAVEWTVLQIRSATMSADASVVLGRQMENSSPPHPAHHVFCAKAVLNRFCNGFEHHVACIVAMAVVDAFEMVDINHENAQGLSGAIGKTDGLLQVFQVGPAVVEVGQRVQIGQQFELRGDVLIGQQHDPKTKQHSDDLLLDQNDLSGVGRHLGQCRIGEIACEQENPPAHEQAMGKGDDSEKQSCTVACQVGGPDGHASENEEDPCGSAGQAVQQHRGMEIGAKQGNASQSRQYAQQDGSVRDVTAPEVSVGADQGGSTAAQQQGVENGAEDSFRKELPFQEEQDVQQRRQKSQKPLAHARDLGGFPSHQHDARHQAHQEHDRIKQSGAVHVKRLPDCATGLLTEGLMVNDRRPGGSPLNGTVRSCV